MVKSAFWYLTPFWNDSMLKNGPILNIFSALRKRWLSISILHSYSTSNLWISTVWPQGHRSPKIIEDLSNLNGFEKNWSVGTGQKSARFSHRPQNNRGMRKNSSPRSRARTKDRSRKGYPCQPLHCWMRYRKEPISHFFRVLWFCKTGIRFWRIKTGHKSLELTKFWVKKSS